MVRALQGPRGRSWVFALLAFGPGCTMVPRSQVAECQRTAQTLRAENARFKEQNLALLAQNRDYSERAVDDSRRLAVQEETIAQLEDSNRAFQDDRDQLEAAFRQLKANLGELGTSTVDAHAWPGANSRSAGTGKKSAAGSATAKNSGADDGARVR